MHSSKRKDKRNGIYPHHTDENNINPLSLILSRRSRMLDECAAGWLIPSHPRLGVLSKPPEGLVHLTTPPPPESRSASFHPSRAARFYCVTSRQSETHTTETHLPRNKNLVLASVRFHFELDGIRVNPDKRIKHYFVPYTFSPEQHHRRHYFGG